jgi:hypothetical protein
MTQKSPLEIIVILGLIFLAVAYASEATHDGVQIASMTISGPVYKAVGDNIEVSFNVTNVGNVDLDVQIYSSFDHQDDGYTAWEGILMQTHFIPVGGIYHYNSQENGVDIIVTENWPDGLYTFYVQVRDPTTYEVFGENWLTDAIYVETLREVIITSILMNGEET